MIKKIKNSDFIWNTLGNLFVSFISMIFMIVVLRINGVDNSGILNYGFTIAVIFYSIGIFCGRTFQVSDKNKELSDSDFIYSRYITTFLSLVIMVFYLIITNYKPEKFFVIGMLCVYKLIESISDVYHGLLQKHNKLYFAGKLLCLRSICAIILFIAIDIITKSLIFSCLSLIVNNIIFLLIDMHLTHKLYDRNPFKNEKVIKYIIVAFSPFILNFLVLFTFSIPRYIIDYSLSDNIQALYGIIIMPASLISLMGHMIIQPSIVNITKMVQEQEYNKLNKLIIKLCKYSVGICLILILGTITFGIPVLNFIYGIKLNAQLLNLIIIIVGSLFYMIIILISNVLIVMRRFKSQIKIYLLSTIFGFLISYFMINNYNLTGAAISYLLIMFIQLILFIIAYKHITSKTDKKNNTKRVAFLRSTSILNDSRTTKEVKSLLKNGYKVTVFGWDRDLSVKETDKLSINGTEAELVLYKKKSSYGGGIKVIINMLFYEIWLYKTLKKYHQKYDIIHACDFDTGLIGKLISKKYNKFLVYDMFDYYIESRPMPLLLQNIVEKLEIGIINYADFSIICSEWRYEQIKKSNPKKVIVIHNTPQINDDFKKGKNLIKSNSEKLKIAYIGILQDYRLIVEVVDEFKNDKNIEIHVGGFGKYENYIQDQCKNTNNIYYYGNLNYTDVLKIESKVDLLFATYDPLIKNHKYSAPNKVYEAMALGKPVIVCKGTGIDTMVQKHKIGESINYDVKEFRKALNWLFKNEKELENLRKRTKKLYETQYCWDIMEKRLIEAYNKIGSEEK